MSSTPIRAVVRRSWRGPAAGVTLLLALATVSGSRVPAQAQDFDINNVLWCEGKPIGAQSQTECESARTMLQSNCTVCHTIATVVTVQKTAEAWDATLATHRERVTSMSDGDLAAVGAFLKAHFNPENPVPELPDALRGLGVGEAF